LKASSITRFFFISGLTPPLSFSSSLILFAIEGAPISLLRRVERFQRAGNCGKSGREPGNRDQAAVF
jgi:hypothetical protein